MKSQKSRDFDKTPSDEITDIQTPTLEKSLSFENLETPQDIRNIRVQLSILKSHVIYEFPPLNQTITSLSENLDIGVNNMKVQYRNVDLFHENIKILQDELVQKNETSGPSWKFNTQCLILYQRQEINQLSQIYINNNDNNNLSS